MSRLFSVNVGRPATDRGKPANKTGIDKHPVVEARLRAPGPRGATPEGASGVVGDFLGDLKHHGGDHQAVYAYAREDLEFFEGVTGRILSGGYFGENLTTIGVDVNGALIGERWRIGDGHDAVELRVTSPRIPCNTFRAWVDEPGWLKTFTAAHRPGSYLAVERDGIARPGDPVEVLWRPDHGVTIAMLFRALTTERSLAPDVLAAAEFLEPSLRDQLGSTT